MKKIIITFSAVILVFSCKDKEKKVPKGEETVITTGIVVADLNTNYYPIVNLRRTIKDSLKLTVVDSTGGKITQEKRVVRDTVYYAWWGQPALDSAKNVIKSKINPQADSVKFMWVPIKNEVVIHDFDKRWKEN